MKILILGHNGMLGNAVFKYFKKNSYDIETFDDLRWDSIEFKKNVLDSKSEYIINCIGAIPQKKMEDKYYELLNIKLPEFLEKTNKKIIHPSTDCVFSGKIEYPNTYKKNDILDAYDLYGKSKANIDILIRKKFLNTKIIRTSIFGHEKTSNYSFLDWYLNTNKDQIINGFVNFYWNGISTLEWAKLAEKIINDWNNKPILSQFGSEKINKAEFLRLVSNVYNKHNKIINYVMDKDVNKILESDIVLPLFEEQLIDLKNFYNK